ncbi:MAG TPA: glutamate formimidoyltransferase [Anaerolineales bacterium]|nr:glutamate formimidoyltransferase [Anaerolineales bacterium]
MRTLAVHLRRAASCMHQARPDGLPGSPWRYNNDALPRIEKAKTLIWQRIQRKNTYKEIKLRMTTSLVECIANFSEARRPEVVEAIRQAIEATAGVAILDQHSDLDHNRTVLTFVGPPEEIGEAAFRAIARAAELIDLDQHQGEHPRIGASDVVPFVPIQGVTMPECVELARRLGERVGRELEIPVYLYEEAATRPERVNLENIRRGQYEALKLEIATQPEREPDFGPRRVGPAGATVIGARQPLVAFNVYLTSEDVSIAEKIAKAVRNSSGGLRFVKALGLLVEGRAQVSMNLTHFRKTPLARVVELVRREAQRYGVGIHHSELVGLIPQEALVEAARWYLQLDQLEPEQILEQRLAAVQAESPAAVKGGEETGGGESFLDALAAGTPAPGGGSAAAYAGAAGAALVAMVARLTIGKKKYAAVEAQMQAVLIRAEELRAVLQQAVEQDSEAFKAVMEAYRLAKETLEQQAERSKAIEGAMLAAARAPLKVAGMAVKVLELASQVIAEGNSNAISDGASAAAMARAALNGSGLNVRINVNSLADPQSGQALVAELEGLEQQALHLEAGIRQVLQVRAGLVLP